MKSNCYDLVVMGGGIVGVTVARTMLCEKPNLKVALVEKERELGMHQSSHNSGVIHSGIYYQTDSLKAKFCVEGMKMMYDFCDKFRIPYKKTGKLIVAVDKCELATLDLLFEQAKKNKVPDVNLVDSEGIKSIEPFCRGIKAIYSPHTGITDYKDVVTCCANDFKGKGGCIFNDFEVCEVSESKFGTRFASTLEYPIEIRGKYEHQILRAKYGFTCGGLYADKLSKMATDTTHPEIIPFRGEYLVLSPKKRHLVKGNIYPVPDRRFPFLGVHFTLRMNGDVWMGPNALLAFSREGYQMSDLNFTELKESLLHPAFRKLILKHGSFAMDQFLKSIFTRRQLRDLQKYIPAIEFEDISKGPTGVRAQAVDKNGDLIDDMILHIGESGINERMMHMRNAPSPAATSSLALAEYICKIIHWEFELL